MSEAPPFWFKKAGAAAWLLAPFGYLYGAVTTRRMRGAPRAFSGVPVLCVGNFITGGAGKTPTAIALSRMAKEMGLTPGFLSRGYGGSVNRPTQVDIRSHNARDVGDEPLILALHATTVVSPDRPAGAALLEETGVDLIIMDDGLQNPSLHKDYRLAVVDARRGLGNGFPMPAGPLRAYLKPQLAAASAILLIGRSEAGTSVVRKAAKMAKPILMGRIVPRDPKFWRGKQVLAFAGIADPVKFYRTLEQCGADIVQHRSFHDHHVYSPQECSELLTDAERKGLTLVTTEKDWVRLVRMGPQQEALRAATKALNVDLEFENPKMAEVMLRNTLDRAEDARLRRKR